MTVTIPLVLVIGVVVYSATGTWAFGSGTCSCAFSWVSCSRPRSAAPEIQSILNTLLHGGHK